MVMGSVPLWAAFAFLIEIFQLGWVVSPKEHFPISEKVKKKREWVEKKVWRGGDEREKSGRGGDEGEKGGFRRKSGECERGGASGLLRSWCSIERGSRSNKKCRRIVLSEPFLLSGSLEHPLISIALEHSLISTTIRTCAIDPHIVGNVLEIFFNEIFGISTFFKESSRS